jgi:isoleucyl-tRNA synthetase
MITAMAARDDAPFKTVLTHGFVVDEKGEKMSKSKGNFISTAEASKAVGADIFRLWVASANFRDDINTSIKLMEIVGASYRSIRNTLRFLLGNLHDFDPARDAVAYADMARMDRLVLAHLATLKTECLGAYDKYEFHTVYVSLVVFCNTTLSAEYLDSLKDILYCESRGSKSRRSAQTALWHCLRSLIELIAPLCPFTAEEAFAFTPWAGQKPESVHLLEMAAVPDDWMDPGLLNHYRNLQDIREAAFVCMEELRQQGKIGKSADARVLLWPFDGSGNSDPVALAYLHGLDDLLPSVLNDWDIVYPRERPEGGQTVWLTAPPARAYQVDVAVVPSPLPKCERCWRRIPTVGQDAEHTTLCDRCAAAVKT